jgi:MoxR-like ATPase
VRINFDEGLESSAFIGANTIENGDVVWKAGTLTQAIQYAGSIILLDEVGFARPQNISKLHAVTERSVHRALEITETGELIPVATGVVFFAADNSTGHGDESGNFAGVREQNSAFLDRFSYTLRFNYLPEDQEVDLITKRTGLNGDATRSLVKFANTARSKARLGLLTQPPSLRQMFAWARAIKGGMPVGKAFNNAIVNKFPSECEAELRGIFAASIDAEKLKSYLGVK